MSVSRREALWTIGRVGLGVAVAVEAPWLLACDSQKDFTSGNFPYSIKYPASWTGQSLRMAGDSGLDMFLMDVDDPFKGNISIESRPQEPNETLERALKRSENETLRDMGNIGLGNAMIVINPRNLDPYGFGRIAGEFDSAYYPVGYTSGKIDSSVVIFIAGGMVWHAILTARSTEKEKQMSTFKNMLSSFKLRKEQAKFD